MAQQDSTQIIADAADAVLAGKTPDNLARAVGWAAKVAVDNEDTAVLIALLLVGAGYNKAAIHQLVDMSFGDGDEQDAVSDDEPLNDLIGGDDEEDDKSQRSTPGPAAAAAPARSRHQRRGAK